MEENSFGKKLHLAGVIGDATKNFILKPGFFRLKCEPEGGFFSPLRYKKR